MGTTMRETIFTDRVVIGLKNWQIMARKSLHFKESNNGSTTPSTPSRSHSLSTHSLQPLMSSPRAAGSSLWTHGPSPSFIPSSTTPTTPSRSHSVPTHWLQPLMSSPRAARSSLWTHGPSPSFIPSTVAPAASILSVLSTQSPLSQSSRSGANEGEGLSSSSSARAWNGGTRVFEFPTKRRELEEIQKVTEGMMGTSGRRGGFEGGEMSFRMWWKQEMISPIGARRTS